MEQFQTKIAVLNQVQILTDFQVNMALQTQNFKLDRSLVSLALKYFLQKAANQAHNRYGMILVRISGNKTIGSQMVTFQNDDHWWFQSVYVAQTARRQGHFSALFQEAVKLGKQKGVKNIKLYVQNNNLRAKSTYLKLGMKPILDIMHSYDFVYGGFTITHQDFQYTIKKIDKSDQITQQWLSEKQNLFTGINFEQNDWNYAYQIVKQGEVVGISKLFYEFSDWRFGLIWYFRELYLSNSEKANYQLILKDLMAKVVKQSQLKVGAIRIIYRESQNLCFEGGHKEHYDILQIDL